MNLPAGRAELIAAVTKANPNTIVILNGGSPSVVEPWLDDAAGLIMYWYGGTEGGTALAHVLFGDVNPSGHLPCTWPRQLADSPAHFAKEAKQCPGVAGKHEDPAKLTPATGPQVNYTEGILVGYRWYDAKNIEPLFPFGYGLSYTSFDVSDLKTAPATKGKSIVTLQATVTNTGKRSGDTVVQLYVAEDHPSVIRPPRELKGFAKMNLDPGQSAAVTFDLDRSAFAHFAPDRQAWIADAGEYTIYAGDSSRHLPVKMKFTLPHEISYKDSLTESAP